MLINRGLILGQISASYKLDSSPSSVAYKKHSINLLQNAFKLTGKN